MKFFLLAIVFILGAVNAQGDPDRPKARDFQADPVVTNDKAGADDKAAAAVDEVSAAMKEAYAKHCPTDATKCTDTDSSCGTWAALKPSECTTNPDWMLPNCAKSCCPICTKKPEAPKPVAPKVPTCPTKAADCKKNTRKSCHGWATQKDKPQCTANAGWMIPNCMESCCEVCKTDAKTGCPTVRETCANSYAVPDADAGDKKCIDWAKAGECKTNQVWMQKNCSKSCCPICEAKPPARATAVPIPAVNWGWNTGLNTGYTNFGGYNTGVYTGAVNTGVVNTGYNFGGYGLPYGYGR